MTALNHDAALNSICPYFTMFPLEFPLGILKRNAKEGSIVLDPFCGRGTTNYAARLLGLSSVGVDSSPVAAAIARAKRERLCESLFWAHCMGLNRRHSQVISQTNAHAPTHRNLNTR